MASWNTLILRRSLPSLMIACCLVLSGCGQHVPRSGIPRTEVVIKVTRKGAPLTTGFVDLNNDQTGEGGGGVLTKSGEAVIPGVPLGDYIVTLQPPSGDSPTGPDPKLLAAFDVPKKFRVSKTSPLKLTVSEDSRTFELELLD